jgi:YggT family protein
MWGSRHNGLRAMLELLQFIDLVLQLYMYVLFAAAVLSWLIAFGVINMRKHDVAIITDTL